MGVAVGLSSSPLSFGTRCGTGDNSSGHRSARCKERGRDVQEGGCSSELPGWSPSVTPLHSLPPSFKVLGVVENMSGFLCPNCGHTSHVFGSGGASRMAAEIDIEVLGKRN